MAVTAKDVAEACGVSRITVNRALSGNENVKPETREKILKKAQEMGYVPNLIARSLVNGKSKMIGIIISDIKNLYFLKYQLFLGSHSLQRLMFLFQLMMMVVLNFPYHKN